MLEADHLRKVLKTEEGVIAPGNPSQGGKNTEEGVNLEKKPKLKCLDQSCTTKFSCEIHLNRHMWTMHGVGKGLECDVCGKRQNSSYHLSDHMRSLHEAQKLHCEVVGCDATFIYYQSRVKHMKTKHDAS